MRKYYGKEKCKILKQIRAEIARQNDIEWVVSECKHKGNCRGTCPKCESEVRELEAALAHRRALGQKVAVVGISAGIALAVTGCEDYRATGGAPMSTEYMTETAVSQGEQIESNPGNGLCDSVPTEATTDGDPEGETDPGTETDTDILYDEPTAGVPMPPEGWP